MSDPVASWSWPAATLKFPSPDRRRQLRSDSRFQDHPTHREPGKAYATTRAELAVPWEYYNLISHGFQAKGEKDALKIQEARDKYASRISRQ